MGWVTSLGVFFVIWWVMLFTVLPLNIRGQWEDGVPDDGTEPGAPVNPQMLRKVILTTIVSLIVFVLIRLALAFHLFDHMIGR